LFPYLHKITSKQVLPKSFQILLDKPALLGYNNKAISAKAESVTTHGGITQLVE
jgi:hypothetical protein